MGSQSETPAELDRSRSKINNINEVIVHKITARMKQVEKVKEIKQKEDIPITDGDREKKVITQFQNLFEENNINSDHGEELAKLLIKIAKEEQRS